MTNFTKLSCALLICAASATVEAANPYYYGTGYVPAPVRTANVPATYRHTAFVAPHNGYAPVHRAPVYQGYRPNVRTAAVAPTNDTVRDGVPSVSKDARRNPFSGRQAILDSRLTTGTVIR